GQSGLAGFQGRPEFEPGQRGQKSRAVRTSFAPGRESVRIGPMNQPILTLNGLDVTLGAAGLAFAVAVLALLVVIAVLAARGSRRRREDAVRQERQDEAMEKRMADLARIQAETAGRLQALG